MGEFSESSQFFLKEVIPELKYCHSSSAATTMLFQYRFTSVMTPVQALICAFSSAKCI